MNLMSYYFEGQGGALQRPVCEKRPNEPLGAGELKKKFVEFLKNIW